MRGDRGEQAQAQRRRSGSMHDGVEIWEDDPCACEAEPRWEAVREEMEEEAARARGEEGKEEGEEGSDEGRPSRGPR